MICDHNIEQTGRNQRSVAGLVVWAMSIGIAVWLVKSGAALGVRSVVFLPFMLGSVLLLQSMYRTCVVHAVLRSRELATGAERVANPEQLRVDAQRAKKVMMASALLASLATLPLLLIP